MCQQETTRKERATFESSLLAMCGGGGGARRTSPKWKGLAVLMGLLRTSAVVGPSCNYLCQICEYVTVEEKSIKVGHLVPGVVKEAPEEREEK